MDCHLCEKPLTPLFREDDSNYQFDNNLWIGFFGGYGMFIESKGYVDSSASPTAQVIDGATYEVVICHDCAHDLCEREPWMKTLLLPEQGHSHTSAYLKDNPTHVGWDNK